jgi:acylphosphatase
MTGARVRRVVRVSGRVQGVGFRAATLAKAEACGVAGFVRNTSDGGVEAAFEGDPEAVAMLVEFCRGGPRLARVERVEAREEAVEGTTRFEFRN